MVCQRGNTRRVQMILVAACAMVQCTTAFVPGGVKPLVSRSAISTNGRGASLAPRTTAAAADQRMKNTRLWSTRGSEDDERERLRDMYAAATVASWMAIPVVFGTQRHFVDTHQWFSPGPQGLIEAFSYVVMISITAWSVFKSIRTGTGLPTGKLGLLGASEWIGFILLFNVGVLNLAANGIGLQLVQH